MRGIIQHNQDGLYRALQPVVAQLAHTAQILEQIHAGQVPEVRKGSPFTAHEEANIRRGVRNQFWRERVRAEALRALEAEWGRDHG